MGDYTQPRLNILGGDEVRKVLDLLIDDPWQACPCTSIKSKGSEQC